MLYKHLLRPMLFSLSQRDPELAHERTLALLATLSNALWLTSRLRQVWAVQDPALERTLFGLRFPNPLGLAAGMDKDGIAIPAWAALGLGFVEVGTVTLQAQPGNPRPRLFRLVRDQALINRMGFNNHGAAALASRLSRLPSQTIPIGVSLGKSRVTPVEAAINDYCASFRTLYTYGDYFAINVSSPNTPGLRTLQDRAQLDELLAALQSENWNLSHDAQMKPLLVKIAPDLSDHAIGEVLEVCSIHNISGIIATNTTLSRERLCHTPPTQASEAGGLSGKPLAAEVCRIVRFISRETGGRLPIIGVGGIFGPSDALAMLDAGASLLQVYTGLVYEGPAMVRRINRVLLSR
ncbi:MAG: quinone-dependent dihydroorotate dehydrogenase [Chloroflexales bacterium]|nr:quinone-dependent dihydroorotate dehydrogenase [Chloroflexales bacterium]